MSFVPKKYNVEVTETQSGKYEAEIKADAATPADAVGTIGGARRTTRPRSEAKGDSARSTGSTYRWRVGSSYQ